MKKIIVIVLAAVIVLGGAAAVYFLVLSPGDEEKPVTLYEYVPGDYFVANLKGSNKLFKVTISLMVDDQKLVEELGSNESVIRHAINKLLRELEEDDITDSGIMEMLQVEITNAVNDILGIDNIKTCYFSDFVMQ